MKSCEHRILLTQTCVACNRIAEPSDPVVSPVYEAVNRPKHYNQGEVECIDAMAAAFGDEAVRYHCLCNAFKYIWRADYKGKSRQDLEKAIWYLRYSLGDDPRLDQEAESGGGRRRI